jgi:aminopeptidase N
MSNKSVFSLLIFFASFHVCFAQQATRQKKFTRADTLRGSITPERAWWNVLKYDISVMPDFAKKTLAGKNTIQFSVSENVHPPLMQVDLQQPLIIDSVIYNKKSVATFSRDGNAWFINVPEQQAKGVHSVDIYYSGKPREAVRAPWDGGWTFTNDSLGRPWMTVTCQGLGASVWYPCKDHQSDEPDHGASLTMRVPDTLVAVANGRLESSKHHDDGTKSYKWTVASPINNYNIIPYIGKYVNFSGSYNGEKGKLDLNYWVLDYNLEKAKSYMPREVFNTLKSFEYWFGPYPFYKDGYQLIDVPHTGMEHQSAVAYGNQYKPGYRMRDGSGTGWGLKWDFIIVHESGHEWFGNNITSRDLADMWIHEGFTNYSETLYVDYIFGKEAANEYNAGIRRGIRNDRPIIPAYDVNDQGSGDMYPKSGNMLHTIRHSIDDDQLFRNIMRGLNKNFYHQVVTRKQVQDYISKQAKYNFSKVFDQYLTTTQIPTFEFYFSDDSKKVFYRWTNCINGFDLPLVLQNNSEKIRILPKQTWQSTALKGNQVSLFDTTAIQKMYYVKALVAVH